MKQSLHVRFARKETLWKGAPGSPQSGVSPAKDAFMAQKDLKIPEATVQRLSVYLRCLEIKEREGQKIISSHELATCCGFKAAQIRKDFAYFGELGVRGVGYYIKDLSDDLKKILGLVEVWKVVLVGAGNLGSALMSYRGFLEYGVAIEAVFDIDPSKVPPRLAKEHQVYDISRLREIITRDKIKIAILTVPADAAQEMVDQLVAAGIKAILNFVPAKLKAPEGVKIRNVDLAVDLGVLTFFLTGRKKT
jgi:redox-sensing transcriptional repressor